MQKRAQKATLAIEKPSQLTRTHKAPWPTAQNHIRINSSNRENQAPFVGCMADHFMGSSPWQEKWYSYPTVFKGSADRVDWFGENRFGPFPEENKQRGLKQGQDRWNEMVEVSSRKDFRRHPHYFPGRSSVSGRFIEWATIKMRERESRGVAPTNSVPSGLPPAMRISFPCSLCPTVVFRCISGFHAYPWIRGSSGRIGHPRSHGGVLRLGIITRARVSGGIVSVAPIVAITSGRVGILRVHFRRRRHHGLIGTRVADLRRRVRCLGSSVGRMAGGGI